ncbi:Auxin-responsive protein IAA27-like protein [Drosera capensis]
MEEEHHLLSLSSHPGGEFSRKSGLKTELRLGLPGSESPERSLGFRVFGSGGKRVFTGDDDGRWGLSMDGGGGGGKREMGSVNGVVSSPKQPVKGSSHGETTSKAQMVGWPPIRSFRRNTIASASAKRVEDDETEEKSEPGCCLYVKVGMDGAPYLRKVDLNTYRSYAELSSALEKMFRCFIAGQFGSNGSSRGYHGQYEICASELPHDSDYVLTYEDKDGDWMLVGDVPWKMFAATCRRLRVMKGADAIGLGGSQYLRI